MVDHTSCQFAIEITDIEYRGSRAPVTTEAGLQSLFYDGDVIRGYVSMDVASIYHAKYVGIDLIGTAKVNVQRTDSSSAAPKSFRHKEVFMWKTMTLAGTTPHDGNGFHSLSRHTPQSPAVTSHGRIVQFNKGRHLLPFELTLETGCTPESVQWHNHSMASHNTHNANASLSYRLKYVTL